MNERKEAFILYLVLCGLFVTSFITSNLIFQKFFYWEFFGYEFQISVGIIAYPVTFIITDLVCEIYGKKRADDIVKVGVFCSLFMLLIVFISDRVPATSWSAVDNRLFTHVFGLSSVAVGSSMIAYLIAQFIDIRIFHFWKQITKGKHLWLRNNASTFTSQFIDTISVLSFLCIFKVEGICENFQNLLINGFLFKVLFAIIDTPLIYLIVFIAQRRFKLKRGEEINLIS